MRGQAGRHEPDRIEPEDLAGGLSDVQMSAVDRIEGAAEQTDVHGVGTCAAWLATSRQTASSRAGIPSPLTADTG